MTTDQPADFVVLHPDGTATYGSRKPGEEIADVLRRHISDMSTQGLGRLRMWFADTFTTDMPPNPLANLVIGNLGYHAYGWYGPVAVTMEEGFSGEIGPLSPETRAALNDLLGRYTEIHAHVERARGET